MDFFQSNIPLFEMGKQKESLNHEQISYPIGGIFFKNRFFAVIIMKVPPMADSISEGTIQKWQKKNW